MIRTKGLLCIRVIKLSSLTSESTLAKDVWAGYFQRCSNDGTEIAVVDAAVDATTKVAKVAKVIKVLKIVDKPVAANTADGTAKTL